MCAVESGKRIGSEFGRQFLKLYKMLRKSVNNSFEKNKQYNLLGMGCVGGVSKHAVSLTVFFCTVFVFCLVVVGKGVRRRLPAVSQTSRLVYITNVSNGIPVALYTRVSFICTPVTETCMLYPGVQRENVML